MKFAHYCTCGAVCRGSADPKTAAQIQMVWERLHTGPGHSRTDSERHWRDVRAECDYLEGPGDNVYVYG
jgi:hypothetical protein